MTETIQSWPEGKLCSSQNASCFIICVVLFLPFLSNGTTPTSQNFPGTQDLHDFTPHELTQIYFKKLFLKTHPNKHVKDQHRFEDIKALILKGHSSEGYRH